MGPPMPETHLLTWALVSPASVSQTPVGSALVSADTGVAARAIVAARIRICQRDIGDLLRSVRNNEEGWLKSRKTAGDGEAARRPFRSSFRSAGLLAFDGLDRGRGLWTILRLGQRRFARGDEFGPGGFGRPIQVADDGGRQREQNQQLHQQGARKGRPIDAAIIRVLVA